VATPPWTPQCSQKSVATPTLAERGNAICLPRQSTSSASAWSLAAEGTGALCKHPTLLSAIDAGFASPGKTRSSQRGSPHSAISSESGTDIESGCSGKTAFKASAIAAAGREILMGKGAEQPSSGLAAIVNHAAFEGFVGSLIVVNAITIALEAQYHGHDIGHRLGFPGYSSSGTSDWSKMEHALTVLEAIFGALFCCEVLLKVAAFRLSFFRNPWNLFDMTISLFWLAQEGLLWGTLVRILRLCRWISMMDSLHVLIKSIQASLSALLWSTCLIAIMIAIVSLIVQSMVISYYEDESVPLAKRLEVFSYFGTFSRSGMSLFESTLGNFAPIMRMMSDNVEETWALFFIGYKCVGGFAVVTVITGVFMQETFRVAEKDDDLLVIRQTRQAKIHTTKMSRLFQVADQTGTGALSFSDFKALINDPFIKTWLAAHELDVADVRLLFRLMDDGDGRLTAEELMAGVSRFKGVAKSYDLHTTMHELKERIADIHAEMLSRSLASASDETSSFMT